jgi:predicted aspartyl protease
MGRVNIKVKLKNYNDITLFENGYLKKEQIREYEGEGLVDTGATMISIPKNIFEKLGLKYSDREVSATYANGAKEKKKIARGILVEILDRSSLTDCLVEEKYEKILIGQIPLEEMDLYVDCREGRLVPRAESPEMPMIDIL